MRDEKPLEFALRVFQLLSPAERIEFMARVASQDAPGSTITSEADAEVGPDVEDAR
jgi:hypothetical protein